MGESWPLPEHCLTTRADVELQGIGMYPRTLGPTGYSRVLRDPSGSQPRSHRLNGKMTTALSAVKVLATS